MMPFSFITFSVERWDEVNWLFNVTINDISVIYVTGIICAGGMKKNIPFSGFRDWEEVENVSANQRQGRPYLISDRLEKHKLVRRRWYLSSCQVSLYSVKRFQKKNRKCLSKSEARTAILDFRSARKKLSRGRWDFASYQISLNNVHRRSRKC